MVGGGGYLLACSSDDTNVDSTTEAGAETSRPDAPGPGDSGPDTADTAPPFDGGFGVDTFDNLLASELCGSLARCCYGTATPGDGGADGGTFDRDACLAVAVQVGFQSSNLGTAALRDAGTVTIDQVAADDCINKVKALTCNLPGTEYTAARTACFGVYSGTLNGGQACKGSAECKRGFYCKGQSDGGTGSCTAIEALNGPCGTNPDHPTEYEEACSYRASGDTLRYCQFYDPNGAGNTLDAGEWKCANAGGADSGCATSTWCKDTICDNDTYICRTPDKLFDDQCGRFIK